KGDGFLQVGTCLLQRRALCVRTRQLLDKTDVAFGHFPKHGRELQVHARSPESSYARAAHGARVRPSPPRLHDVGEPRSIREHASERWNIGNQLTVRRLRPEALRHHQVGNTRRKGSIPSSGTPFPSPLLAGERPPSTLF